MSGFQIKLSKMPSIPDQVTRFQLFDELRGVGRGFLFRDLEFLYDQGRDLRGAFSGLQGFPDQVCLESNQEIRATGKDTTEPNPIACHPELSITIALFAGFSNTCLGKHMKNMNVPFLIFPSLFPHLRAHRPGTCSPRSPGTPCRSCFRLTSPQPPSRMPWTTPNASQRRRRGLATVDFYRHLDFTQIVS